MTHSLTLGSLLLTDPLPDDDHGYVFSVLAEGMGFGVAQGVREIVTSLLADGDIVRTTRFGNREVSFAVQVEGPTLGALAHGEAALRAEVGRRNTLTWQAPDVLSVPTVFDVVDSEMQQTFDDLDELRRKRTFDLSLTCAPFPRSVDPVVVPALSSGATTTNIDTCDSTAGWSGTRNGAPTTPGEGPFAWDAGAVGVAELNNTVGYPPETWTLTRTGAVDFSTLPYLQIQVRTLANGAPLDIAAHAGPNTSSPALPILAMRRMTDGTSYHLVTFDASDVGAVSSLTFAHTSAEGYGHVWQGLIIRNVAQTDIVPGSTARQLTRIVEVGGTERTPGSIHVESANGTDPLGMVIVHSSPEDGSGYSPPLQRWRTVGQTRTADATAFSGNYESINTTSWVAEVPTSALPEGGYLLLARLRAQTAGVVTVTWSTSTIFPDATTQEGFTVGTVNHDFAVGNEWELVKMDTLTLPSVRTAAGKVQIALQVAAASPVVTLDEAWLFREDDDCALTIVETARPHLWLDSPDLNSPVPRVWVGDGVDTKVHPGTGLQGMGTHVFSADGTAVFTAALTDYPLTDESFYRLWPNNAAS